MIIVLNNNENALCLEIYYKNFAFNHDLYDKAM